MTETVSSGIPQLRMVPTLTITCVILGKALKLSEPQHLNLENGPTLAYQAVLRILRRQPSLWLRWSPLRN